MRFKAAPVAVFAFNRPEHLSRTMLALAENEQALETPAHVFLDGPRNDSDREAQQKIRVFLSAGIENKFKSLSVYHSEKNKGLADSIIGGVSKIVNEYGSVIVLEDDLVTSKYFLQYMNEALDRYEHEERVISIHGYVNPVDVGATAFFLRGADCWGWATWARGWKLFESDGSKLLKELEDRNLVYEFTYQNSYDYIGMLKGQISGKNNSWAIRWYASAFLQNKLTLYPPVSLVENIGFDGSGTHCDETSKFEVGVAQKPMILFPKQIEASEQGYRAYCRFYALIKPSVLKRFFNKIKKSMLV